jgi:hypothetical protein
MSGSASDLLWAAKTLLPFLKTSTDDPAYLKKKAAPESETPAQRLRREADEMEFKDAVIERFRDVVATLEEGYSDTIEAAITQAGATRERVTVKAKDGAEAYAYPHPRGIAWGVNALQSGGNILRGVRRPDGSDEAVS